MSDSTPALPTFQLPGAAQAALDPAPEAPAADAVVDAPAPEQTEDEIFAAAVEAAFGRTADAPDPSGTGIPAPGSDDGVVAGEPVEGLAPGDPTTSDNPLIPTDEPADPVSTVDDPTADLIDLGNGTVASKSELFDLYAWANSLTPAQQERILQLSSTPDSLYPQSAASGSGTPTPVAPTSVAGVGGTYPPNPAVGQPGMPITPPATQKLDPRTALGEMAELVPGLATYLEQVQADQTALQTELASYRQQQASQMQAQADAEQARIVAGIQSGHESFVASHPELDATDLHYLQSEALAAGLVAPLMAKHGNDPSAAYSAALETIMWSTPKYRDQIVQQQAQAAAQQQAEINDRRNNAAALGGSGGSVSRDTQPAPASTMNSDQRQLSLREAIAAAIQS